MPNKIMVLGHTGRLGSSLVKSGYLPLEVDITDYYDLREKISISKPDIIINCAAITDVDECEDTLRDIAIDVNDKGVWNLRTAFRGIIIHMSTDYIFDGRSGAYTEKATPNPISHYGKTKYIGERYLLKSEYPSMIIRTTMLYGVPNFSDFVFSVLTKLESSDNPLLVTTGITGSPTYVPHLVYGIQSLLSSGIELPKIINISGTDILSRYEFALMIASVFGHNKERIKPVSVVKSKAKRPPKAGFRLTLAKRLGVPLYSAIEGLEAMKYG